MTVGRNGHRTCLGTKRIEVDRDQQGIAAVGHGLGVKHNLIVIGGQKTQVAELMQGRIVPPDRVDLRHQLLDVAGLRPSPAP